MNVLVAQLPRGMGYQNGHRRARVLSVGFVLAIALLLLPATALVGATSGGSGGLALRAADHRPVPPAALPSANVNFTTTTIYYSSSVDGWNLSYEETLPSPFNSSRTYPLAIELHGLTGETVPIWGGIANYVVPTTAQAAVNDGMILIDPCTRTGSGWYINSNYTGPQEQDILDALSHEQSIRHIGAVDLFGESMGSIGTLEIGLDHPHLFHGLGAIVSFSDFFETYAYLNQSSLVSWITPYMLLPTGGQYPGSSAYARGIFAHLSSLRFHPENLSGVRLYVANGAQDILSSNNLSLWPYQQENNTLVNRTCLVVAALGEPAGCTLPLATLAALHPSKYSYRYIFEPNGPHDYRVMNASDMFAYFLGLRPGGTYWGTFPYPQPHSPPVPLVVIATEPLSCGSVSVGGHAYRSGDTPALPIGKYNVTFTPCGSRSVASVRTAGGAYYSSGSGLLSVTASGAIVVRFA
ncbi:MAG: hypothetical protein L3K19_06645 [Thermoplasmata archaeon]|nr:hypothetical protein [Thermoplasmata archaeon]